MTEEGWACPSCFRAWRIRQEPQLAKPARRWPRLPNKLVMPLALLIALLFVIWAIYELGRLNGMNSIIRQHMPQ